jgi:hypothetical protein
VETRSSRFMIRTSFFARGLGVFGGGPWRTVNQQ